MTTKIFLLTAFVAKCAILVIAAMYSPDTANAQFEIEGYREYRENNAEMEGCAESAG